MCIRDRLDTTQHVDEGVALFDTAVVSAVDVSSRMKPGLKPDYQRIPEEVSQLACERNRLRRRWQRTRDPADKAAFNRATGKLCRDMLAFSRRNWELAVAQMDGPAAVSYTHLAFFHVPVCFCLPNAVFRRSG